MALDNPVEDRRHGVEGRRSDCGSPRLEPPRQGGGHPALATRAGNRERHLLIVQAFNQALGDLHRAAATPGFSGETENHGPGSDEVVDPSLDLDGVQPTFCGNVEVIGSPEALPQLDRLASGQLDRLFVRQRKARPGLSDLLRYHCDRQVPAESLMEVPDESVADSQQLVRCGAGDRHLDSILKAPPEGPEISFHDR